MNHLGFSLSSIYNQHDLRFSATGLTFKKSCHSWVCQEPEAVPCFIQAIDNLPYIFLASDTTHTFPSSFQQHISESSTTLLSHLQHQLAAAVSSIWLPWPQLPHDRVGSFLLYVLADYLRCEFAESLRPSCSKHPPTGPSEWPITTFTA